MGALSKGLGTPSREILLKNQTVMKWNAHREDNMAKNCGGLGVEKSHWLTVNKKARTCLRIKSNHISLEENPEL